MVRNRWLLSLVLGFGLLGLTPPAGAQQKVVHRYSTVARGAVIFTGNSLGYAGGYNTNVPAAPSGSESVKMFANSLAPLPTASDQAPYRSWAGVATSGVTLDWKQNASTAILLKNGLPGGGRVRHAELIWQGSIFVKSNTAPYETQEDIGLLKNEPVSFITGLGSYTISHDPTTTGEVVLGSGLSSYYVHSADVTALVQAAVNVGANSFTVKGVPATKTELQNDQMDAGGGLRASVAADACAEPVGHDLLLGGDLQRAHHEPVGLLQSHGLDGQVVDLGGGRRRRYRKFFG